MGVFEEVEGLGKGRQRAKEINKWHAFDPRRPLLFLSRPPSPAAPCFPTSPKMAHQYI